MTIYILLIDGSCFVKEAISPAVAFKALWNEKFFDYEFEDFINEINLVEWKDLKNRYIKNYKNKKNPIEIFDLGSEYKLKEYLKVKPSKKPVKELEEEFEL